MFTGIVEDLGKVANLNYEGSNLRIEIESSIAPELKIDQSVAHNGVCLTVEDCNQQFFSVIAINETLNKSNLGDLLVNDEINLERAMKLDDRLDGHMVQGHIDAVAECTKIKDENGSWKFTFNYSKTPNFITVEKGSITVNGVSLTVVDSLEDQFSVAIIPYTYKHTNFRNLKVGDTVNLEFDILGKYIQKLYAKSSGV